jgi:protein HOOK3
MSRITIIPGKQDEAGMTESVHFSSLHSLPPTSVIFRDDHFYRIQSERSQIFSEKETLEKVYQMLLEEHRTLQTNFDDVIAEKEEALARLREVRREMDHRRDDKVDVMMRAEIERLRAEL